MSSNLKVNTILPSAGSNIGLGTNGGNLNVDGGCKVQVGTALTLGHTVGVQFATQNLHSAGFEVNQINASGIITASHFYGSGANLTGITQTTINNNADNRIITGSGTANTLNGEANLTFDGNLLKLQCDSGEFRVEAANGVDAFSVDSDNGNTVIGGSGTLTIPDTIVHAGDTNTKIRFPANDTITFETNNTERFRIGSNGYIGVGNFSSKSRTDPLNVDSGIGTCNIGGNYIHLSRYSGSTNYITAPQNNANLFISADDFIVFGVDHSSSIYSHNTEAFRIDSSGRLLIGTTATDNRDGYNSSLQVAGTSGDDSSVSIGRYSADTSYPALVFSKSRNATINSHTRVNTGDYLGGIQFQGDDGTRFLVGANIVAQAASPVADYDMATDLIISTNSGTTSPNKSMTLDHQGRFTKPFTPFVMAHINTTSNRNTSGGQLKVPWDVIHGRGTNSNMGSHFDTSNNRFTAPVDGRYLIVLSMNEVGDNIVYHRINNTQVSYAEYRESGTAWDHMDASFIYDMNANDYYETWSLLTGTGQRWNGGGSSNGGWDTLSIYLLG